MRRTPTLMQSQSTLLALLLRREPLRPGEGVRVSAAAPSDFRKEADGP